MAQLECGAAVLLAVLLCCCASSGAVDVLDQAMIGGAMREARTTASSIYTTYTINSTLFNSSLLEILVLEKAVCSKGTFFLQPPAYITPRINYIASFGAGWMVQGHGGDPNEISISCSVIYRGQETGYGIRFSFEKTPSGSACWAVWRPDGNDINYPLATSWRWYKIGAENNMDLFVYDLQFGNPVKQGVNCPGN